MPSRSRTECILTVPSVRVPVLSVHRMSMLPKFSIDVRCLTMTLEEAIRLAPWARLMLMASTIPIFSTVRLYSSEDQPVDLPVRGLYPAGDQHPLVIRPGGGEILVQVRAWTATSSAMRSWRATSGWSKKSMVRIVKIYVVSHIISMIMMVEVLKLDPILVRKDLIDYNPMLGYMRALFPRQVSA